MAIICSCSIITDQKVKECLNRLERESPPSANVVLNEMGCTIVCGTCAKHIKKMIREHYNENVGI